MVIITISIPKNLLNKLEEFMADMGYSTRSEAFRTAIRNFLSEYESTKNIKGRITATITVISGHNSRTDEKIMRLRHEYSEIISGNLHIDIEKEYCVEIFIAEGIVQKILEFINKLQALETVYKLKYTIVPLSEK
ncbi:MAG: CopG family ribbon-helix-helix protein [Candidatus Odinarchaeia archaeon]